MIVPILDLLWIIEGFLNPELFHPKYFLPFGVSTLELIRVLKNAFFFGLFGFCVTWCTCHRFTMFEKLVITSPILVLLSFGHAARPHPPRPHIRGGCHSAARLRGDSVSLVCQSSQSGRLVSAAAPASGSPAASLMQRLISALFNMHYSRPG